MSDRLDFSDLDVDTIDVVPADSLFSEGHGTVENGASSADCLNCGYCSCYTTATSCFVPEEPNADLTD